MIKKASVSHWSVSLSDCGQSNSLKKDHGKCDCIIIKLEVYAIGEKMKTYAEKHLVFSPTMTHGRETGRVT